jgi:hypothetical protein
VRALLLWIVVVAALAAAPKERKFSGKITDSMCAMADHSRMRMGADDAECTIACIRAHGALYVLQDGKNAYTLSDQTTPEKFAGKKVTVVGSLNAKTMAIQVRSIALVR